MEDDALHVVDEDAGQIARSGNPRDALHVPAEGDFFQAHGHHAGSTADDEHRAAHTGTIGEELPEDTIAGKVAHRRNVVHAHATGHEGHVVHHGRRHTDEAGDEEVVCVRHFIQPLAKGGEYAGFLQSGHSQQDAEEEEDGGHVDLPEDARDALLHRAVAVLPAAIEHFCERPKRSEHQEDAHEGGQVGEAVEDGHKEQAAHTETEDAVALDFGELMPRSGLGSFARGRGEFAFEAELQNGGRHNHRNKTGDEDFLDDALGGEAAFDPEHDGGHIADGGESTTGVGGNDDERSVDDAVVVVVHQFAEHHNHHNGGGEIVKHGRKEEGHKGHFPHQCALGAGVENITHEVEPSIGIDDFHHRHGANQEEKGFGHFTQVLAQDVGGDKGGNTLARGFEVGQVKLRDVVSSTEGVEHPAGDSHEQSDGRFVDFQPVFEGDAEIAQHKNGYDDGGEHKGEGVLRVYDVCWRKIRKKISYPQTFHARFTFACAKITVFVWAIRFLSLNLQFDCGTGERSYFTTRRVR